MERIGRCTMPQISAPGRSEEHTSELQSRLHLVCRLLLEKKKKKKLILIIPSIKLRPAVGRTGSSYPRTEFQVFRTAVSVASAGVLGSTALLVVELSSTDI